jgi:threonine dehydrogenase-like Zn-dependent dehydrogenase
MFGAGDVRIGNVPDAKLIEPTDALVRVTRACICGSDLWPYNQMQHDETGRRMGHEFIGVVDSVGTEVRSLKTGDVVVAPFLYSDGTCVFCQAVFDNVTISGGPAPARAYIEELLPDVLEGRINPGRVLDRVIDLDGVPDGYRAMNEREAIKVMVAF